MSPKLFIKWISTLNKQDGRLSPAYFQSSNLYKDVFSRLKAFFSDKYSLQEIFLFFEVWKIPDLFFWKRKLNLGRWEKKKLLGNNNILYKFRNKFATFTDFEKTRFFFRKKIQLIFQKTQNSYVFEKHHYFSRILRQICIKSMIKKTKFRIVRTFCPENWQVNEKDVRVERMIFLPYLNMGRNY